MSIRITQNSFSKGVLSPSLQGRVDLEQYNLGAKKINNGIVLQEGCIVNRSGLEFLAETKYSDKRSRLVPFVFGLSQNYIIEFGDRYLRFIKDGGYILDSNNEIYELETEYTQDEIFDIDYVQQADVLTIVHKNHPPVELARIEHNIWELKNIDFKSLIEPPSNLQISYTGSTQSNTTIYKYLVTSVSKTTKEESSRSEIVSVLAHLEAYWTTSEYITLNWESVEDALEYNVYRSVNGIFGYVGTTDETTFKDTNIEPDLTSTAPLFQNPFSEQNPSSVCYFQQRKIYASTDDLPETFWTSQTGTNNNFNVSRPLNATDSISMSISDNVSNRIQHLIPLDNLIIMTTNAEWSINGSDGVLSASNLPCAKLQSYYGSSKIKPVISGSMVLFVQSGGNIVRDLGYNYLSDSYDGEELTIFANHLFERKQIVDMAYSKEPNRILWCIMDDGTINALTYNPKQKISAWHTHSTRGEFESVCTIRENNEDIAYFIVKRFINNQTVRYIERFKTRNIASLEDSFFLDCALRCRFENKVETISGLDFLKNETVNALLDYGVVEDLTVDNDGVLKLPYPSSDILVGLPYCFEFESLNLENESTLGIKKIINKIEVKTLNSREDFFIKNADGTISQNARSHDSINNPKKLYSANAEFCPLNDVTQSASVSIIQKYPLPLNILAISTTLSLQEVESQ